MQFCSENHVSNWPDHKLPYPVNFLFFRKLSCAQWIQRTVRQWNTTLICTGIWNKSIILSAKRSRNSFPAWTLLCLGAEIWSSPLEQGLQYLAAQKSGECLLKPGNTSATGLEMPKFWPLNSEKEAIDREPKQLLAYGVLPFWTLLNMKAEKSQWQPSWTTWAMTTFIVQFLRPIMLYKGSLPSWSTLSLRCSKMVLAPSRLFQKFTAKKVMYHTWHHAFLAINLWCSDQSLKTNVILCFFSHNFVLVVLYVVLENFNGGEFLGQGFGQKLFIIFEWSLTAHTVM